MTINTDALRKKKKTLENLTKLPGKTDNKKI